jgi:hypothetical protein
VKQEGLCLVISVQVGEVASIEKLSELWEIDKAAYGEASLTWEAFK